jgi:phospholipid transport system substrate-binding protein
MMRRSLFSAAFAVLAAAMAVGPAAIGPAKAAPDPTGLIRELGNQALAVLGKNVSPAERTARFRQLFREDFDVPAIARFVLGRYWRVATEAERQEFVRLFEGYIALAYANRLAEYSGETLRVIGSRPDSDGAIVASEIIRPNNAPPAKVEWRVTLVNGGYRITDVVVEGVSMAVTQRSEFASVIQRNGGKVEGLLTVLRQKMAAAGGS